MNHDQETTAMIHALAKQLGQWLAAALHRVPTKGETDILLQELAEMPNPCSTTDVADAIKRAADRLGVAVPVAMGALCNAIANLGPPTCSLPSRSTSSSPCPCSGSDTPS